MRIVIDLQGAQTESRHRGIGRYSLSFAQAIARNRGAHEIFLALNDVFQGTIEPIRAAFDELLPQENIRIWKAPSPVRGSQSGNTWRREAAERIREAFLVSLQPDIVHISSLFEGYVDDAVTSIGVFDQAVPVSVSLYDLIPLLNQEHFFKSNPAYELHYRQKLKHLKNSSLLLAISEYCRQEGIDSLHLQPLPIVNVSTATEACFRPLAVSESQTQAIKDKYGVSRPFVLYTGVADERKNLPRLIRAYASMSGDLRNLHQLVFAGKTAKSNIHQLREEANSAGLRSDELLVIGYIEDDELVNLYNLCKLYVFPSYHEGFGLPALEAMSCGAAVIGANTTSLPEVIGNADALFDPYSEEAISRKIALALTDEEYRESLSEQGLEQAKHFSWDKSARRAISAFEEIDSAAEGRKRYLDDSKLLSKLINSIASIKTIGRRSSEYAALARSISISLPKKKKRQLFLDISELVKRDAGTGVQRVTRSIVKELLENPLEGYSVEPVYANTNGKSYCYAREFTARSNGAAHGGDDEYIGYQAGDIFLGIDLQHHTTRALAGFLSTMRLHGVKVVFVVYDLLPIQFPHYWPTVNSDHAEWLGTISQFDAAVCISHSVEKELNRWLATNGTKRLRPFKTTWFHLGADLENSVPSLGIPDDADRVLKVLREHNSFLMVGTLEPRKGHAQTLTAFEKLWAEGFRVILVIVGKQGWMVKELIARIRQHPELGKGLFWLEGISDEYLGRVYDASTCLIISSEGEGFGLPLIEAAQHKLPIIARDIPVFREVAGENAYYFTGLESEKIAIAVQRWLALYKSREHPVSDNIRWQTWHESAKQLLKVLNIG